jgi:hypothetical protein
LSSTITAPNSSIVSFECWVYNLALDGTQGNHYITLGTTNWVFSHNTGGVARFFCRNDAGTTIFDINSSSGVLKLNQWQYLVGIRSGSNAALYVDGVRVGTATGLGAATTTQTALYVCSNLGSARYVDGYLSNVRIQSGTLPSGYDPTSTTIAVPTTPLAAVTGTLFLSNMTNAGIYDAAAQNDVYTIANAQVGAPAVPKFGINAVKFNGTTDYLTAPSNTAFAFGSADFTIEFWLYANALPAASTVAFLFDTRPASTQGAYPVIYLDTDGTIKLFVNSANRITSSVISTGTWYYVALTRSSGVTKMFLNGTQTGSNYTDSTVYLASALFVGASYSGGASIANFFNGYIQDLRITRGVARPITASPTAPFPVQ